MLSRTVLAATRRSCARSLSTVERLDGPGSIVVLDFAQIQDRDADLSASIEAAYSANGHGIVAVKGVPDYVKAREALLPLAFKFANFSDDVKAKYEVPEAFYAFGWSHGKEKLEGKPDWSKGSFYNNPLAEGKAIDPAIAAKFPAFYSENVWPDADLPELRDAFLNLGNLVCGVGFDLASHCDKYVASVLGPDARQRSLEETIRGSKACKGRLLHYFPEMSGVPASAGEAEAADEGNLSSWCGWHNDHGTLTGLAGGGMYFDADGNEVGPPSANAGLYIKSRAGQVQRVVVPRDYMAFQIGETAQVHSGGVLQATPHCVSAGGAANATGVSRSTFAIFMEPEWDCPMDLPANTPQHPKDTKALVPGVPDLAARWAEGQNFAEFNDATLAAYY